MSTDKTETTAEKSRMSLAHHLIELRKRLFKSAFGLLAGAAAGWILSDFVMNSLRVPVSLIATAQNRSATLNFADITSAFDLKLQIALTVGAVVSSPIWLFQIFAFLVPGLTKKEKRYTFGFFFTAVPLFLAGCISGWFVLPQIVALMTSFAPAQDAAFIEAKPYYDFVLKLVLAIGIAFVLPVFIVLLNFIGILSAVSIIKSWRIALVVIVLFTAVATPAADIVSMFMLAIPMILLYFLAAGVAGIHDRRVAKNLRLTDTLSPFLLET
ncbi:sec-independent protein translocase protein TatC [Cryobacterium levicorallinum]|uniref:Sec-independent protein translocase protein TatC n=2 Tax=Cryobacterium levicorallinum TaxID=995038 RepID=A0ABY1EFL8_9MICO|nr:twin-arginine translocase subunit TatC [Cryobacterium levicorallinum]SFH68455.1 sec-independent protein translocase protein TatC [Cryobacterium levicorallinum]